MIFKSLAVGQLATNCFVLACEKTRQGIIVDPGDNAPAILDIVRENDIQVVAVAATHGHFDHIGRAASVLRETGAPFAAHRDELTLIERMEDAAAFFGIETDPPPRVDRVLADGDIVQFGESSVRVLHTPGHSPGGIALAWPGHAVVGDLIFAGSVGRTDFEGGDPEVLLASVRDKIFPLGDDTRLYPGHGPFTTVERERRSNPFLTGL